MKTDKTKPSTKVRQWADYSINFQIGCEHGCAYCYACEMAKRRGYGKYPLVWENPKINMTKVNKGYQLQSKDDGTVKTGMCPSTHDITPRNIDEYIIVLGKLLKSGNRMLIVSKPHLECIRRICTEFEKYKKQMLFRFTVGSADNKVLKFWEPGAPDYEERLESLKLAYDCGFETSISSEPMLDDNIHQVVKDVRPYVTHSIWLGKANRLHERLAKNCTGKRLEEVRIKANELIAIQCDANIHKLYGQYKDDELIRWKDSIKEVVGIEFQTESGLDI